MQKLFRLFTRRVAPDLAQLSASELADFSARAEHKQKIRNRLVKASYFTGALGGMTAGVWLGAALMGAIAPVLPVIVYGMGVLGLVLGQKGAALCTQRFLWSGDMQLATAENARRAAARTPPPAPVFNPALLPPDISAALADAFANAAHTGLAEKMTVRKPLQLVRKAQAVQTSIRTA